MNNSLFFLNSLNIGILILDLQYKIIFTNQWLKNRTSNHWEDFFKEEKEKNGRFFQSLEKCSKEGLSSVLSSKLNTIDYPLLSSQESLNCNLVISRISPREDDKAKIMIQFIDVTQVEEREKHLKLQQKIMNEQREHSFNQERLASLGELTSSIAHEINNPLAILDLSINYIKKYLKKINIDDEKLNEAIHDSLKTIKRMTTLIAGVRGLANNGENSKKTMGAIHDIMGIALIVFKEKAKTSEINLFYDADKSIFHRQINLNASLLTQVFVNLLNNSFHAIKDLEERWIKIEGEEKENTLFIYFIDSGLGIPLDVQEKIFIPFFTTKEIGEGTGLGLSTSKKILNDHGGDIVIDNKAANTTFIITIPLPNDS